MTALLCTLDLVPPSVNHAYITTRRGARILTADAAAFRNAAILVVRTAARQQGFIVPPKKSLALTLYFFFARNNRDGDNAVKILQDAIAEALGFNDKRIVRWCIEKRVDKHHPHTDVVLSVLEEWR